MSDTASHAQGEHEHPPFLQHHFDTPVQQFDSGKLGMWLFLATEVLLFAGLFCAYAVYRGIHPEVFLYAHHYLDTTLGAINTVILLLSSLTMAWAVRASQLGQRKILAVMLCLTLLGGFGFMSIKYVEYSHKIHDGLLWGTKYEPKVHGADTDDAAASDASAGGAAAGAAAGASASSASSASGASGEAVAPAESAGEGGAAVPGPAPPEGLPEGLTVEPSNVPLAPTGPSGTVPLDDADADVATDALPAGSPENVHVFFGIYFLMTGLHGIHVVIGMGLIAWILVRSLRGDFSPAYFTPVDLVGLYWHLVDLIWIFLFPLLYLIH